MDSFITRLRRADEGDTSDASVQNEVSHKLRKLRSLDLKALKLAIQHELVAGPPRAIVSLQDNCAATKSDCWNFFSRVMERGSGTVFTASDRQFVACRACFRTYAYESGSGTSSLNNHIKNCSIQAANAAAGSIVGFAAPQKVSAKLKLRVSRAAAVMSCKDLRPFTLVEGKGFKLLASTLLEIGAKSKVPVDVDDLLPVGNTVKNHVVKVAKGSRTGVQNVLVVHFNNGYSAGFTVDLWTDNARKLSFISITVHFIDSQFKLHARTLQVKHFDVKSHTAKAVLQYFDDCLRSYHIYDRRMFTVVCDSDENMYDRGLITVVTDSGSNMSGSSGFRSRYDWIACADHKIATVLTTILCKTTETVDKVRSEPFYRFQQDAPAVFVLIDACKALVRYIKQANLQHELSKTLKQENVTRWGSQYRMMSSVLEMFDELTEMLTARQKFSYMQKIDRFLLDELVRFLAQFQESTLKLESWKKPTLHLVAFEKYRLTELLKPQRETTVVPSDDDDPDEEIPPDSVSLITIKQLIATHALPKWKVTEKHIVAAMLDPRQKTRLLSFGIEECDINNARNLLVALMREYSDRSSAQTATIPAVPAKKKRKNPRTLPSLDDFEEEKTETPRLSASTEEQELEKYLSTRLSDTERVNFDLLKWWKQVSIPGENGEPSRYPALGFVARSILAILASSAMSESNFSDAGNAFGVKRSMLSPSILNDILVARSNVDAILES